MAKKAVSVINMVVPLAFHTRVKVLAAEKRLCMVDYLMMLLPSMEKTANITCPSCNLTWVYVDKYPNHPMAKTICPCCLSTVPVHECES